MNFLTTPRTPPTTDTSTPTPHHTTITTTPLILPLCSSTSQPEDIPQHFDKPGQHLHQKIGSSSFVDNIMLCEIFQTHQETTRSLDVPGLDLLLFGENQPKSILEERCSSASCDLLPLGSWLTTKEEFIFRNMYGWLLTWLQLKYNWPITNFYFCFN